MRTVLVHDYLNQYGGAERVLESLVALYPDAPIHTSIYDPDAMPDAYRNWSIKTSFLDSLPAIHAHHQWYLPGYPWVFDRMQIPHCDLVLSSSSAFAKWAQPPPGAVHVCYCHSPARFAWSFEQYCEREQLPKIARIALNPFMSTLRRMDRTRSRRVDRFVANSTAVRDRIRAFYGRDADVVFPPVDTERFQPAPAGEIGNYFILISRLVPYKRIDIVVDAFNHLGLPLYIVGGGRDRQALEQRAAPNVRFLGRIDDAEVQRLTARCRAAVFMSEDDFGIAQVEVQAAGRPVIALARGGVLDSVRPDETGVWVHDQSVAALIEAVQRFESLRFDQERLVAHASSFSESRFRREMQQLIDETIERYRAGE